MALSYELEVERNGGDWRLKKTPGQKHLNGKPPGAEDDKKAENDDRESALDKQAQAAENVSDPSSDAAAKEEQSTEQTNQEETEQAVPVVDVPEESVEAKLEGLSLEQKSEEPQEEVQTAEAVEEAEEDEDDEDGWITPSNLKKHQAKDSQAAAPSEAIQGTLQAALLTSDFAMQNVALRMNLK